MKRSTLLAGLLLLLAAGCGTTGPKIDRVHPTIPGIEGNWISARLGGSDIGDELKTVEYMFRRDGSFSATATMSEDRVQSYDGTYNVLPSALELTIPEMGSQAMPYTLSGDMLTINDPELDSWIEFRRTDRTE